VVEHPSPPAVANGVVYVGSLQGNVAALNATTGAVLWSSADTNGPVQSSPAVADGMVYVGGNDGEVYALSAATGAQKWAYTTGNAVESSPAVALRPMSSPVPPERRRAPQVPSPQQPHRDPLHTRNQVCTKPGTLHLAPDPVDGLAVGGGGQQGAGVGRYAVGRPPLDGGRERLGCGFRRCPAHSGCQCPRERTGGPAHYGPGHHRRRTVPHRPQRDLRWSAQPPNRPLYPDPPQRPLRSPGLIRAHHPDRYRRDRMFVIGQRAAGIKARGADEVVSAFRARPRHCRRRERRQNAGT
jgi:hypothetical protein